MSTSITPALAQRSRLLRTAGIAAIVAGAGYIALPLVRLLVQSATTLSEFPKPSEIPDNEAVGVSSAIVFFAIGTAVLVLSLAATQLGEGLAARLGSAGGVAAAIAFGLVGAGGQVMYSWIAANLTETGANQGAQVAALWAINVISGAPLLLAAAGVTGWTIWLVVAGRAVLGRPVAIAVLVLAAVILIGIGGFSFNPIQFAYVPLFAVLAIALLLAARRARRAE